MTDWDNRTMPASPRRRFEARQRGEVAQSRLLRVSGQLLVTVVALAWLGSGLIDALAQLMRTSLREASRGTADGGIEMTAFGGLVEPAAMAVLPVFGVSVISALLIGLIQTGWLWAPAVMAPRWDRLNPAGGLARILGGGGLVRAVTVFGQLVIVVAVGGWFVASRWGELVPGSVQAGTTAAGLLDWLMQQSLQLAGGVAVGLLVLGGIDWGHQRWRYEQQLKMTPEEWREDQRNEQSRRPPRPPSTATFQQVGQSVD